jgi:4,5-dihydroxyphthalate decarboxylase
LTLGHHEIFQRFTLNREWDVSELSFAKFMAQVTRPDADIIGLPVYASRMFRFSMFYVNRHKGIRSAADLKGKKVGLREWAHTAAVYMRGWLEHDAGVPLSSIDWYQAGTDEPGRLDKVEFNLPPGVRLTSVPDKTLSSMIISGELDAVMVAHPPKAFQHKHPDVLRFFPEYLAMEEEYYARTQVYPIMHVMAVRKAPLEENPWIARNLYNAFEKSKALSLERLFGAHGTSRYPVPWLSEHAAKIQAQFGYDPFPYGIEKNRATLELALKYAYEQGLAHRNVKPEDIFPAGIDLSVRV